MNAPLPFTFNGDAMIVSPRFLAEARQRFTVGERYVLDVVEERQAGRDKAYHAEMRSAWSSLPEDLAADFRQPDDFRHWCLIECGFCTVQRIACANEKEAFKAIGELRRDGAQIGISGAVVVIKRPLSQRHGRNAEMDKITRARSYRETLDLAASLIGVRAEQIERSARATA